ncbi:hypothetical protein DBZ36_10520 [Alginatibacterium sediminis]|uniref:Uncharacterized protein n=1 Tax=Alginatibacterium sediminis TaxID=2164068 RepID=A0A420EDP1_9ALTE|nr:hypothetical protein [Alginatibacterium sediminis]RKF18817.1 hypothetical protein DBZ36_10520 [Alginatibacterium sediminis]
MSICRGLLALAFSNSIHLSTFGASDKIVGCWQPEGSSTKTLCFIEDKSLYLNIVDNTIHGSWIREGDSIDVTLGAYKLRFETQSLTAPEHVSTSNQSTGINTDNRTDFQLPEVAAAVEHDFTQADEDQDDMVDDITAMISDKSRFKIEVYNGDTLAMLLHCSCELDVKTNIASALKIQGLENGGPLVERFLELVCNSALSVGNSEIELAYQVQIINTFYNGNEKLADLPCKLNLQPSSSNKISLFGLFMTSDQVSRWQVLENKRVNIWLGQFLYSPSDSVMLEMSLKSEGWQVQAACYSTRL